MAKNSPSISLTKPAMLAAVAYLIMAFVILLPFNIGDCDVTYGEQQNCYNFWRRLLILILMLIPFGLSIYSINCMMVGNCIVWSWVNGVFVAVWVLLFILAAVMSYDTRKTSYSQQDIVVITSE